MVSQEQNPKARLSHALHLPELDGVRGIAILMVLLFHTFPVWAFPYLRYQANLLFGSLWIGVDVFFVLSGFLITRSLLGSKNSSNRLRVFYTRRTLRVFPLYFLALSVSLWILPYSIAPQMKPLQPLWPWFYGYAINIWTLFHNARPSPNVFGHFWSLAVEEQFYLCWPLVVFHVAERKLPLVTVGLCVVAVLAKIAMVLMGFGWEQIYVTLFTRMDSLALGALSAYAYVFLSDSPTDRIAKIALWGSGATLLVLFGAFHGFSIVSRTIQLTVTPTMAVFCSAGIYYLLRSDPQQGAKKFCSLPLLRFFGKYSYGLYVYHWIIYYLVMNLTAVETMQHPFLPALCVFVFVNALSMIISIVSFHAFESQFLKLRRRT